MRYGQDDICVLTAHHSSLITQTPESQHDYRRTLYWNPNLLLDENGEAHITLYNNSRTTQISVDAAGQAADGTLLWGSE